MDGYKSKLEEMNKTLMETNTALKVLAKNIENTKEQEERKVARLLATQVIPVLNRLRKKEMPQALKREVEILFGHMSQLAKALEKGKGIPSLLSASITFISFLVIFLTVSITCLTLYPRSLPKLKISLLSFWNRYSKASIWASARSTT